MTAHAAPLPLFEQEKLKTLQKEREALLKLLQRGGADVPTRMRREKKLKLLTARQIVLEARLGMGAPT